MPSLGLVIVGALVFWLFQALCVYWGALAAGLRGSYGRAMLVLLASILTSLPFVLVVLLLYMADTPVTKSPVLLSSAVLLGAQTLAFKWVYDTTWGRALFGFLASSILSTGIVSAVLLAVF